MDHKKLSEYSAAYNVHEILLKDINFGNREAWRPGKSCYSPYIFVNLTITLTHHTKRPASSQLYSPDSRSVARGGTWVHVPPSP